MVGLLVATTPVLASDVSQARCGAGVVAGKTTIARRKGDVAMKCKLHRRKSWSRAAMLLVATIMCMPPAAGCNRAQPEQKPADTKQDDTIVDIEAPGVDLEVDRSKEGGSLDLKVKPDEGP